MCQRIFFFFFQTILKDTNNWVRLFWEGNTHFPFEQHYILEVISLLSIGLFLDQDTLSSNEELRKFSLMLCMVLLRASRRHNSDLDCAAGWDKFKDFTLIWNENSGHFLLSYVILHTVSLLAALLQKGHGAGVVEGYSSQEKEPGFQPGGAVLQDQWTLGVLPTFTGIMNHQEPKISQTQTKCLCCFDCNYTEEQYHKNWDTEFLLNM